MKVIWAVHLKCCNHVMVTGAVSGFLSDALGYKMFFIVVMFATIPILSLIHI